MLRAHSICWAVTRMNSVVLVAHMGKSFLSGPSSFFLRGWLHQRGPWWDLVSYGRAFSAWTFGFWFWMTVLTGSRVKASDISKPATFVPSERWILPDQLKSSLLFYWEWTLLEFAQWILTKTLGGHWIPLVDVDKLHSISHCFIELVFHNHVSVTSCLPNWGAWFPCLCIWQQRIADGLISFWLRISSWISIDLCSVDSSQWWRIGIL